MYESMQLSSEEADEHSGRVCFQREAEASPEIHFRTPAEWWVTPADPSQDAGRASDQCRGCFCIPLGSIVFFPPFLRPPLSFLGVCLPTWSPSLQWFSTQEILLPGGFCCCWNPRPVGTAGDGDEILQCPLPHKGFSSPDVSRSSASVIPPTGSQFSSPRDF